MSPETSIFINGTDPIAQAKKLVYELSLLGVEDELILQELVELGLDDELVLQGLGFDESLLLELGLLGKIGKALVKGARAVVKEGYKLGEPIAETVVKDIAKAGETVVKKVASVPVAIARSADKAVGNIPNKTIKALEGGPHGPQAGIPGGAKFNEGDHPRGPDGQFIDKGAGSIGKAVQTSKAAAGDIVGRQYEKDFGKWADKRDQFNQKAVDNRNKDANKQYDAADARLQIVSKLQTKLEEAKKQGAVDTVQKIQSDINKNVKKADDLRKKGDDIYRKAYKPFDVPAPTRPPGFKGFKPPPNAGTKGTGTGLIPKAPAKSTPTTTTTTRPATPQWQDPNVGRGAKPKPTTTVKPIPKPKSNVAKVPRLTS